MTLPRLYALNDYWRKVPPLPEAVAALAFGIGVLKQETPPIKTESPEGQAALASMLAGMPMHKRERPA